MWHPQSTNLTLTSLTSGGRSVGIVRSRTQATEFTVLHHQSCHYFTCSFQDLEENRLNMALRFSLCTTSPCMWYVLQNVTLKMNEAKLLRESTFQFRKKKVLCSLIPHSSIFFFYLVLTDKFQFEESGKKWASCGEIRIFFRYSNFISTSSFHSCSLFEWHEKWRQWKVLRNEWVNARGSV
jgi:hypothetical protein